MKRNDGLMAGAWFYLGFFRKYTLQVCWSLLFCALALVPWLINPIFVKIIIDQYIPNANVSGIFWLVGVLGGMLLLHVVFHSAFHSYYMMSVKQVSKDLRNKIVRRLQMLSLSYYYRNDAGRYYSKIMVDVDRAEQFAVVLSNSLFKAVIFLSVTMITLLIVSPTVLGIFMSMLPLYIILILLFRAQTRRLQHSDRMARENLSASVNNFLQTSVLSRMHGNEWFEQQKIDRKNAEVVEKSTAAEANLGLFAVLNSIVGNMTGFLIVVVCALFVIKGSMTFGEMMLFVQYMGILLGHVQMIIGVFPTITTFAESMGSIREILDAPDIEFNQGKRQVQALRGDIKFEDVSFIYDNTNMPALRNVNIHIKPGTTVGLVGQSGGGKSTFVNLILGLYRTDQGIVMIDDMPVNDLDMRTVRHHIGVVSQSPIIFTGTVLDNIRHQNADVPLERVIEVSKMAHAHEFVSHLPHGYDTILGERGVMLSGGQKQRIALARTLLRQPKILILDEATSALDLESEALVQQALEAASKEITTFVIAHRLSTVAHADTLLVFRDGQIIEQGTHETLRQRNGEYAKLIRMQDAASGVGNHLHCVS